MYFCQIFGLSKLLTGRENGSQKGITGREFGSQNHLPDGNLVIKYYYRTGIRLSNIITGRELGYQISLPDMSMVSLGFEKIVLKMGCWSNLGGEGS